MKASDLMTPSPACCTPDDDAQAVARKMLEFDCGSIPVVDERNTGRIIGVVTDRDLACRCLAWGTGPETKVSDIMTREISCCSPEADALEIERVMTERQVRRVPIVDGGGHVVGIVAQADLARAAKQNLVSDREVGIVVEGISEPTRPPRNDFRMGRNAELRL
jgi:CBS domain-containing protein